MARALILDFLEAFELKQSHSVFFPEANVVMDGALVSLRVHAAADTKCSDTGLSSSLPLM
jgi:hypothetical protein